MSKRIRWVVREGEGTRLSEVLARVGEGPDAVADGRVFIGRRRALVGDEPVRAGDELLIAPRSRATSPTTLLVDEDGLVAADKPAEIATIPGHDAGSESLLASVARTLGVHPLSLHPTSRLDRGVSGVVIFARTASAADRLTKARASGAYVRRYVAIAADAPTPPGGTWDGPIGKASDPRHRAIAGRDAVPALSRYATVARAGSWALLALEPVTGRTHQLRLHASHGKAPLLGDRAYGGPSRVTLPTGRVLSFGRIALHAARVCIPRADGGTIEVASAVPPVLREWWRAAAGDDAAWDLALGDFTALRG